jgi:predicted dehydrogenase
VPEKIGYALLGASKFGEFCLRSYATLTDCRLAAVWNRTPDKSARLAAKYGLKNHATLADVAGDPDIAVVHVVTIPSLHTEHIKLMLEAGKHVFSEKPLAVTVADAQAMIALANARGLRLGINFVMRYGPLWNPLKILMREALLGAPLRAEVVNCAGDSGLPADHWFWDEERSGGIFIEHGVHFFDLIASWFGAGGTITGASKYFRPGTAMVEQVHCDVRYGEQTSAGFYHGFHQLDCLDRQRIRLIFEYGEVTLLGWVAGEIEISFALDRARSERMSRLFPGARSTRVKNLSGVSRRRGREESLDGLIRMTWVDPRDDQALYAAAVRDAMSDFLLSVSDPGHTPRVTAHDGLAALRQATCAREYGT